MAKPFSELRARLSPESQARVESQTRAMLADMPLEALRRAQGCSQQRLAEQLHIQPSEIATIEKRTDLYLSALRSQIEAMGGQLEVIVRFPEGEVKVSHFANPTFSPFTRA